VTVDSGGYGLWWLQPDNQLSDLPYWRSDLSWIHSNLLPSTSYYYKVKARNGENHETDLSIEGVVFTPSQPGPTGFIVKNRTVDTITWAWPDQEEEETGYRVYSTTGGIVSGDLPADTTEWLEIGLSSNTCYVRFVRAVYAGSGESLASNTTDCYTLLNDPTVLAVYMVGTTSITVGSPFTVPNISSAMSGGYFMNVVRADVSGWIHQDSWTSTGLAVNTRYGFLGRVRNGAGVETNDTPVRYVYTAANVPGESTLFKVRDISLEINIDENENPEETGYSIRITTPGGIDCYAHLMGTYSVIGTTPEYYVRSAWGASCQLNGLSPVTTYYLAVRARNGDGLETDYSAISTTTMKGCAPLLTGEWDSVNRYHAHVSIQPGSNPADMLYAVLCINSGLWLDGSGGTGVDPVYLTKTEWESIPHRNAQTDLLSGNKYWYRVRAQDPVTAATVDSADSALYILAPPNVSITEEDHDRVGLQWQPVVSAEEYAIYSSTASDGQLSLLERISGTSYDDDIDGLAPSLVTGLYAAAYSSSAVTLSWAAPEDPQPSDLRYYRVAGVAEGQEGIMSSTYSCTVTPVIKGYKIYRNGVCVTTVSSGTVTYTDTDLSPETQYAYRVSAVSSDDLEGLKSDQVTVTTFPRNAALPEDVIGLQIVAQDGTTVHARFMAIRRRADGSSIDGYLRCYAVYRSASLNGTWEKILTILPGSATEFTDTYGGQLRYYRVKAVDIYDKESEGLMTVSTVEQVFVHSSDRQAVIIFDDDAKEKYLYAGTEKRIKIVKDEEASNESRTCYSVTAYDPDGNLLEDGPICGSRLGAELIFYYSTDENAPRAVASRALAPTLFWYNSLKWVRVNGDVDPYEQSISLRTKTLGQFSIQYTERSGSFRITSVEPKIFSPDEANTVISRTRIYIENPNYSEVTSAIFDLRGNAVRRNLPRELETVLYWDGRDTAGTIVPSGVYLYQIEVDGKVLSGTVVVAR
jgi:hypothetical protein